MSFLLTKEHKGAIVRLDALTVVEIPNDQFKAGDILVIFNNTDQFGTIKSNIKNSYRANSPRNITHFECPPKALVNIVFIADDIVVLTFGM